MHKNLQLIHRHKLKQDTVLCYDNGQACQLQQRWQHQYQDEQFM
jgi:hypothetical protein